MFTQKSWAKLKPRRSHQNNFRRAILLVVQSNQHTRTKVTVYQHEHLRYPNTLFKSLPFISFDQFVRKHNWETSAMTVTRHTNTIGMADVDMLFNLIPNILKIDHTRYGLS